MPLPLPLPEAIVTALRRGARLHDLIVMMYGERNEESMLETGYGVITIRYSPYIGRDDVLLFDRTEFDRALANSVPVL